MIAWFALRDSSKKSRVLRFAQEDHALALPIAGRQARIPGRMRFVFFFLLFSAQTLFARLERYSQLVVGDSSSKASRIGLRVTYLGTNGFEFRSGDRALLVDPYFSRINLSDMIFGARIHPDVARIDDGMKHLAARADGIVVTHGHVDHLFDVPVIMGKTGACLIASRTAIELAERAGVPNGRCRVITAGEVRYVGPWKIRALAATHDRVLGKVPFPGESHGNGPPRRGGDWVCGEPLAYLIEIHGVRIYVDSGGTPAILPPADIGPLDLAILGVALPDSRVRFADALRRLKPRYVFPSHQDDFFRPLNKGFQFGLLTDFPGLLRQYRQASLPGRLVLLDYFQPWSLPRK
jgi:L-ascorbate metabolism protein UlaG (beta-lactamase superfamily)